MAEILNYALDRWSPLGSYLYRAAKSKNQMIPKYETPALIDIRIHNAHLMQYRSYGYKLDRPCVVISGEIHSISGVFESVNQTFRFSEGERPLTQVFYNLSDDECVKFIENRLYRRDDYSKIFSDIMEGKTFTMEAPVKYFILEVDDPSENITLLETMNLTDYFTDYIDAEVDFTEAFDIIDEISLKESKLPGAELEVVSDPALEAKKKAFFEKVAGKEYAIDGQPMPDNEIELNNEDDLDIDTIGVNDSTVIIEDNESMFDDLFSADDEENEFSHQETVDNKTESSLENVDDNSDEVLPSTKTIYETSSDDDLESVDDIDELEHFFD